MKKIAIVGAGTMGQGIIHLTTLAGFKSIWYDVETGILEKGLSAVNKNLQKAIELGKITPSEKQEALQRIEVTTDIDNLTADLVIEAVVENLQVKMKIFEALEKINEKEAIFATNTSSIPIAAISSMLKNPEIFIGLHFFNPAFAMKLVEIVASSTTSDLTIKKIQEFSETIGKTAVLVKDSPGFIVNRVARPYYTESLKLLEEKVADINTIDNLLESTGFK
nr:3-hydroxyacyl-CoA dehydrogenase NAD-binding domain-containing protein [Bacteroidota bacterium]